MIRETPDFAVIYEPSSARRGLGNALGGVRDESIIEWYCEGLDASARKFADELKWYWPSAMKTPVFVGDLIQQFPHFKTDNPFTSANTQGVFIGLPCRICEPTIDGARLKAMTDAAHEAVHVLNSTYRPFKNVYAASWRWFNEGTAVFGERLVLPGNPDNLRFAMDWCDRPEDSLDSGVACYQAGLFVQYLVERFKPDFLARVWQESKLTETPIQTLERLLQPLGFSFASADSAVRDVFGEGYAVDSYCAWGDPAASFAGDAFQRYAPGQSARAFELRAGDSVGLQNGRDVLDHLATRYYRFFIDQEVKGLHVSLKSSPADGENRFKATLVTVNGDWTRGPNVQLTPAAAGAVGSPLTVLEATLSITRPQMIDHIVLAVANCRVRAQSGGSKLPHDDGQEFTLQAKSAERLRPIVARQPRRGLL